MGNPNDTDPGTVPGSPKPARMVSVAFENYNVVVILGPAEEFLGIAEISLRKSFLSEEQEVATSGSYDVSDLYQD